MLNTVELVRCFLFEGTTICSMELIMSTHIYESIPTSKEGLNESNHLVNAFEMKQPNALESEILCLVMGIHKIEKTNIT